MASVSPLRAFGAPRVRHPFEGKVDTRRRRQLKDIARELPRAPGVYFFYGFNDRLLYVGKAKCLRERVRSYFAETKLKRPPKLRRLLAEIKRLEYRQCGSELEALLVERRLIAELRPILNRQHKRFEVYPYLLLSDEEFPRLTLTRAEPVSDREECADETPDEFEIPQSPFANPHLGELPGLYLGPFTTPRAAYWTLEAVRNIFPLRTCEGVIKPDKDGRACFYHDIGRCTGPCVGAVSHPEYSRLCDELLLLLRGGEAPQLHRLRSRMENLAAQWNFEEAAKIKEQLEAIESVAKRLQRLERMRKDHNVVIVQQNCEGQNASVFLVQGGVVRRQLTIDDWTAGLSTLKKELRAVYDAPPPVAPFTGKAELDEMMILDRWLRAHGDEDCCVWLNDRSRCWTATTSRRVQAWAQRKQTA